MFVWAALFLGLALPLSALAQDHHLMLVFGGVPRSRDVYLLSLNPENEVPDCLLDLDQHPKEIYGFFSIGNYILFFEFAENYKF